MWLQFESRLSNNCGKQVQVAEAEQREGQAPNGTRPSCMGLVW